MKRFVVLVISITFLTAQDLQQSGKSLYTKHGCYGCHGSDAKGGLTFPRLANKNKDYLIKKLKEYKKGLINSNRADIMKPYAKDLTDKEIEALATYLNKMPKTKSKPFEQEYELGTSAGS